MTDRKQPGMAFWTTVALIAVLVAYPLSFGPACWIASRCEFAEGLVSACYLPVVWTYFHAPSSVQESIFWYANYGAKRFVLPSQRPTGELTLLFFHW